MTDARYAPGGLLAAVGPAGAVVLGDEADAASAVAAWGQLHAGAGIVGVIDVLAGDRPLAALPDFVIAVAETAGWRVAVRGSLIVAVDGAEPIRAAGSPWTERSIFAATLTLGAVSEPTQLPLVDGVARVSALTVRRSDAVGTPTRAAAPRAAGAPVEPVQPRSVAEVHRDPGPVAPATITRTTGQKPVSRPGDHDGETISLAEARRRRGGDGQTVPAVAPPHAAARLQLSTGQSVLVDRPVIIGRRPGTTRVTGNDTPHLVAVPSPEQDISRNHLEIRAEGDSLLATDLKTTNGTMLLRRGAEPLRLHPGEPTILVVGDALDLGDGVQVSVEAVP